MSQAPVYLNLEFINAFLNSLYNPNKSPTVLFYANFSIPSTQFMAPQIHFTVTVSVAILIKSKVSCYYVLSSLRWYLCMCAWEQ